MKMKILLILISLIAISKSSISQDIQKINSLSQLDSLKIDSEGNVTLVNFWASWCKPCVQEFPELIRLYNDYHNNHFTIIFISLDFPEEINSKVIPFLKENKVEFKTYYNDFKNADDLMNYFDKKWDGAIPTTFIYDKNGDLKSEFIGNHDYDFFRTEISKYLE